jgi:hypothetical protein
MDPLSAKPTPFATYRKQKDVKSLSARYNRRNNRLYSNYQCVGGSIIGGNILFIDMQSCYSQQRKINTENIKTNKQRIAIVFRVKL